VRLRALVVVVALLAVVTSSCARDTSEVLVIGHRGAPNEELENSIASFTRARELGADGVELDVQLTADGRLVVMHDPTLERTTACAGPVRERTLQALADCPLKNGEPVRTIDEVLALIAPWFSLVFVEIKVDELVAQVERADEAARVVLATGLTERVVLISYDETVLRRLAARRAEGVLAGWDDFTSLAITRAARAGLDWVLMRLDGVDGREGTIVRGLDKRLCVYGINTPAHFVKASKAGVDVMMTDSIRTITQLAGRRPEPRPTP
jgi:glycerophosphoryl diester phosphodiesterase